MRRCKSFAPDPGARPCTALEACGTTGHRGVRSGRGRNPTVSTVAVFSITGCRGICPARETRCAGVPACLPVSVAGQTVFRAAAPRRPEWDQAESKRAPMANRGRLWLRLTGTRPEFRPGAPAAWISDIAKFLAVGFRPLPERTPKDTRHRQVKYLNNVIEADHGKLKLPIRPVRGFKTLEDGLRHDQGLRDDARAAQGPGRDFQLPGRHCRRGPDRRARLRRRSGRSGPPVTHRHGVATGKPSSGQRRIMR